MHGFALNVTTDLKMFEGIVPCGIERRWVTSLEAEAGARLSVKEVASRAAVHLAAVFERTLVWTHADAMSGAAPSKVRQVAGVQHGVSQFGRFN
jgi:lipoate-protein ligase B